MAGRSIMPSARRIAAGILAATLVLAFCPLQAFAAAGDTVVHKKSGMDMSYTIVRDAGAAQGAVVLAGLPEGAAGIVAVPASIMVMEAWEDPATYAVEGIAAGAFSGAAAASGAVERIDIEGVMDVDPAAFAGLAGTATFTVRNAEMVERLAAAGIAKERIACEPLLTKYVAFGDSIAAGYALSEYDNSDQRYDQEPTPSDAFVSLVGAHFADAFGPSVTDNLAASGWTSTQLLDALQAGAYDAALADATAVSVTIGSNDLLGRFIEIIADAFKNVDDLSDADIAQIEAALAVEAAAGPDAAALAADAGEAVVSDAGDTVVAKRPDPVEKLLEKVSAAIEHINAALVADPELLAACETFATTNQPAILDAIHARAPRAQVYWTTRYNPFYGQVLDVRTLFPKLAAHVDPDLPLCIDLGSAGAHYIEIMNEAFARNTEGYAAVNLYEPFNNPGLTNVSIGRAADGSISFNVDPHPNHDGHALIAELVNGVVDATYAPGAPDPAPVVPDPAPVVPVPAPLAPTEPVPAPQRLASTGDGVTGALAAVACLVAAGALGVCALRSLRPAVSARSKQVRPAR